MVKMRCVSPRPWKDEHCELKLMEITAENEALQRMRAACNPQRDPRFVSQGVYWQLLMHGGTMMTDTYDEKADHLEPVQMAESLEWPDTFECLVNGLGLGMVTNALLDNPRVSKVTVIEMDPIIIKHMGPPILGTYGSGRVEIIEADALEYRPPKGQRFGVVWHDIWPSMSTDNLSEMHLLHRRYGRLTQWQGSWARKTCEKQRRDHARGRFW